MGTNSGGGEPGTKITQGLLSGLKRYNPKDGGSDKSMMLPKKANINGAVRESTAPTPKSSGPRVA